MDEEKKEKPVSITQAHVESRNPDVAEVFEDKRKPLTPEEKAKLQASLRKRAAEIGPFD